MKRKGRGVRIMAFLSVGLLVLSVGGVFAEGGRATGGGDDEIDLHVKYDDYNTEKYDGWIEDQDQDYDYDYYSTHTFVVRRGNEVLLRSNVDDLEFEIDANKTDQTALSVQDPEYDEGSWDYTIDIPSDATIGSYTINATNGDFEKSLYMDVIFNPFETDLAEENIEAYAYGEDLVFFQNDVRDYDYELNIYGKSDETVDHSILEYATAAAGNSSDVLEASMKLGRMVSQRIVWHSEQSDFHSIIKEGDDRNVERYFDYEDEQQPTDVDGSWIPEWDKEGEERIGRIELDNENVTPLTLEDAENLAMNDYYINRTVDDEGNTKQIIGHCRDYSTMFTALARSLGIPTRVVYNSGLAHYSNQVWFEDPPLKETVPAESDWEYEYENWYHFSFNDGTQWDFSHIRERADWPLPIAGPLIDNLRASWHLGVSDVYDDVVGMDVTYANTTGEESEIFNDEEYHLEEDVLQEHHYMLSEEEETKGHMLFNNRDFYLLNLTDAEREREIKVSCTEGVSLELYINQSEEVGYNNSYYPSQVGGYDNKSGEFDEVVLWADNRSYEGYDISTDPCTPDSPITEVLEPGYYYYILVAPSNESLPYHRENYDYGTGENQGGNYGTYTITVDAAGEWPMFGHDRRRTSRSPYDTSHVYGREKWNFTTTDSVISSPVIGDDGTIYIGSDDGNLYAVSPHGTEKWNLSLGENVRSTPAVLGNGGTIYVGSRSDFPPGGSFLHAICPNGTLKWSYPMGLGGVLSSPTIDEDGTIYIGSGDGNLYAINQDGTEKWNFSTEGPIGSSPAIGRDGTLYFGSNDNNIYAINQDGTYKWSFSTGDNVSSSPAIGSDGTIYVGSEDEKLYALNPTEGTEKWNLYLGEYVVSSPAIARDGTVYVGSMSNIPPHGSFLHAIYPNGTHKWSSFLGYSGTYSSPSIGGDGTVYIGSNDQHLYAVEPEMGTYKWRFFTDGEVWSSPAIGSDGTIYAGSNDGNLYALGWGHDLTIETDGEGTTYPEPGVHTYLDGKEVTVSAIPQEGWVFAGWTGDVPEGKEGDEEITITMDEDKVIKANFVEGYQLSINVAGGGWTSPPPGDYYYAPGEAEQIEASAGHGYEFWAWGGDVSSPESNIIVEMTEDKSIWAIFIEEGKGPMSHGIEDKNDLNAIRDNLDEDHYLMNDLDLEGEEWEPIGNSTEPFTGTFHGLDNTISGLHIDRPDQDNIGLFGYVSEDAVIENVNLEGVNITGRSRVGSLVGESYGEVMNSSAEGVVHSEGDHLDEHSLAGGLIGLKRSNGTLINSGASVNITGNEARVGGLVGDNYGTIAGSHAAGDVYGDDNNVGGLVGLNWGEIKDSHASGDVEAYWYRAGGLVGRNYGDNEDYDPVIEDSYATGDVLAYDWAGGLVGRNDDAVIERTHAAGSVTSYRTGWYTGHAGGLVAENDGYGALIKDSYALGDVDGYEDVGGLVGRNIYGTIENSYSSGEVEGYFYVGGLVGYNNWGDVIDSFWDIETSGMGSSDGGTGLTTEEMYDFTTFDDANWDITAVGPGETDESYVWNIVDGYDYPTHSWDETVDPAVFVLNDWSVEPAQVGFNETVTIEGEVKNIGGEEDSGWIDLYIDDMDTWVDSEEVTLAPGESTWVNFTGVPNDDWNFDKIGTYNVRVTPRDHPAEWYDELQIEVLFYENFEDTEFPPQGWDADAEWYRTTADYYSGGASARIDWSWGYQEELLMTPWMEISENMTLYFWERSDWVIDYDEHHYVGVYDGNWSWHSLPDAEEDWRQWYIELDNWTGEEVRIGFYYEGTDGTNWYVDEVVVTDSDWGNTTDLAEYEMENGEMSDGIGNPEIEEDGSKESHERSESGSSGSKERDGGDESEKSESQDPEKREERVA